MRSIDSFFTDTVDIPLYHYTGIRSLLGMADTGKLWSSSISYLNDSQEMIHAFDLLINEIEEVHMQSAQEGELLSQLKECAKDWKNTAHTLFVFSLSEEKSLLSQWRSYTPHGKGVSLEFTPEKVNAIAKKSNLKIAKCIYSIVDQRQLISALLNKLLISFRRDFSGIYTSKWHASQCYMDFLIKYSSDIFQILSIIKHQSFQEEREWRLVSPYYVKYTDSAIKFREGASMLAPYIELDLLDKPYFNSVTLGPSQHQDLSMSGLSMFTSNTKVCTKVTNCVIPYREW